MKRGRPTKYDSIFTEKVEEYLSEHVDETYDNKIKVDLPTIEGFALYIGVNKTTLYEWDKKYPEFSNSLNKILVEQQKRLINNGLSGDYNSTIAKLILSSNHGMSDRVENKTEVTIPKPILSDVLKHNSTTEDNETQEED